MTVFLDLLIAFTLPSYLKLSKNSLDLMPKINIYLIDDEASMFGRNDNEFSTVSEFIEKKSKSLQNKKDIFFSKVEQVLHGEHEHRFSKQDVLKMDKNARCKVCGMLLSEFIVQHKRKASAKTE